MKPEGYPAAFRLRKRRDFLRVQNAGPKHHSRHFIVMMVHGGADKPTRLGITVTRKVGPAVVRNRIKRLVREVFRRKRGSFAPGCDMVWIAKKSAASVAYPEVITAMDALIKRAPPGVAC